MVKQFSDLSSLNTQNMIREGYSGVSGIYMFQCTETGGIYIGSSINLYDRFYDHLNDLSSNLHLQNAANKYGWDSFNFRIIETCLPTELITREQFNLDILFNNFPKKLVYNFCFVAYSTLGYTHTAEARAAIGSAISAAIIGNTNRLGKTGYTHTVESKAAMSAAKMGNTHTVESKAAISVALLLNHPNRISTFVYDGDNKLVGEFLSQREAAEFLNCNASNVSRNIDTGKRLRKIYLITTCPLP
jgi:group I intron endonuclease